MDYSLMEYSKVKNGYQFKQRKKRGKFEDFFG